MFDWPNILAGVFLGVVPLLIAYGYRSFIWLRNPLRNKYRGAFWIYHWSVIDPGAIREKELRASFSWIRARPTLSLPADRLMKLRYSGLILRSQGSVIYILLRGENHKENVMFVFNDPLCSALDVTTGVFASVDAKARPVAARALLASRRLHAQEVRVQLKSRNVIRAEPVLARPAESSQ